MAWENYKVEKQRLMLIQSYESGQHDMTYLCNFYGISRKTAYKWYQRYLESGEDGLIDLSRSPHNPRQLYDDIKIEKAIDLKLQYRTWGPKKILIKLKEKYPEENWPSSTRLYEIFKEHHLVIKRRIKPRVPATAPLGDVVNCNDTWAVDLKGWFLTGDGCKCEPLTITDCFSRYLIKCTHLNKHSVEYVWPIFYEAFREYGLPRKVRSDNGPPFGTCRIGRLTKLSINLIKAGVIPEWIQPGHPEQNGRHERFHLTLKQTTANPPMESLALQMKTMNQFHHEYNHERPHEALGMKVPASIYSSSPREWDGILRPPEYDTQFSVRKVEAGGQIKWKGVHKFISETLAGEYIGLKINEEGLTECFYGPIYLGKFAQNEKLEKPKMKERRQR